MPLMFKLHHYITKPPSFRLHSGHKVSDYLSQLSPRASLVTEIIWVNSSCKTLNLIPLNHSR